MSGWAITVLQSDVQALVTCAPLHACGKIDRSGQVAEPSAGAVTVRDDAPSSLREPIDAGLDDQPAVTSFDGLLKLDDQIMCRRGAVGGELDACAVPEQEAPQRAAILKGLDPDLKFGAVGE